MDISRKPERIRQKTIAPLNIEGEIRAKKVICHFDYYLKDSRGKWLPRLYLCEHRTLADIFLEAALFHPKKNVLCISKAEWESSPEEAKNALRKFEKIFREPYQTSQSFVRQLFAARREGKSILFPLTEDARGMDQSPYLDEKAIVRLCRKLEMPVCTVTFRKEQETESRGEGNSFFLNVSPLFSQEEPGKMSDREAETAVSSAFFEETNSQKNEDFLERKRLMMREFLKSELQVAVPVEICQGHSAGTPAGASITGRQTLDSDLRAEITGRQTLDSNLRAEITGRQASDSILRVDMTGITLETDGARYHRSPGALKSLAIYPGKLPETGDRGTILIYPYYDKVFYLFTAQNEDAINIQAAAEEMYRIVASQ